MPYAPLISKIRCYNPNRNSSKFANKSNLTYIATRSGVDLTTLNINSISELLNNDQMDLTKIEVSETKIYAEADDSGYLRYMAKRPRSHGLFGNIDTKNLKEIEKKVLDVSQQKRCIYRGIISLSQKDAEALEFTDKDTWHNYMKRVMPDIAKELGVNSSDFTWVGAFHAEKTHPHVHYQLWDNVDKVKSPFIHKTVQIKCRELLSKTIFDDGYEKMIKEVFKEEREELNQIRNNSRKELTDIAKTIMKDLDTYVGYVPGMQSAELSNKIGGEELNNIVELMSNLMVVLPKKGSYDYAYLPSEAKKQIDKIVEKILERPDMKKEMDAYLNAVETGNKILGKTKFEINILKNKARKDLINRIDNIISKEAKKIYLYFQKEVKEENFIKENIDTYSPISSMTYSLVQNIFRTLLNNDNQQRSENEIINLRKYRSKSKQAVKEDILKQRSNSNSNEL